jgi:cholesterol transport system auxiliary component
VLSRPAPSPRLRLAIAAPALLWLAACGTSLLPAPAPSPARHLLGAETQAAAGNAAPPPGAPSLVVELPRAAPGHEGVAMLYQRRPHQLEAFAFHVWADAPAHLLSPLLVGALQRSGAFVTVAGAPTAGAGTLRLQTDNVRLWQDFGSTPSRARLSLRALLIDSASRRVLAVRDFDSSVAAGSDDPVAGVAAANAAAVLLMSDVAAFCALNARR